MSAKLFILNMILILTVADCRKFKIRRLPSGSLLPSMQYPGVQRYIGIFGIKIVSRQPVCDNSLQHAANILAQLIDCDEDGAPDDTTVVTNLRQLKATLILSQDGVKEEPKNESDSHKIVIKKCKSQDNQRIILTSMLRYLTIFGIIPAYQGTLGAQRQSFLRQNLNIIVGDCGYAFDGTLKWPQCTGHVFYNETSCDMQCMAREYLIELIKTILGLAPISSEEGKGFWDIRNKTDLMLYDSRGYSLIKQVLPWLPKKKPNGNYKPGRYGFKMAWYNGIPIKDKKKNSSWRNIKRQLIEIAVS
eukprot:gene8380-14355_t